MVEVAVGVLEWMLKHWQWFTFLGGAIYGFEKWRGQRLTNKKLRLELDALAFSLTQKERTRIALEITGKQLPKADVDTFKRHLKHWAESKALEELQEEIEGLKESLEETEQELAQFQCPHCSLPLAERRYDEIPGGGETDSETYECGYSVRDGFPRGLCRNDKDPPVFEDYELEIKQIDRGNLKGWSVCFPNPRNERARKYRLERAYSRTEDGARRQILEQFHELTRNYKALFDLHKNGP